MKKTLGFLFINCKKPVQNDIEMENNFFGKDIHVASTDAVSPDTVAKFNVYLPREPWTARIVGFRIISAALPGADHFTNVSVPSPQVNSPPGQPTLKFEIERLGVMEQYSCTVEDGNYTFSELCALLGPLVVSTVGGVHLTSCIFSEQPYSGKTEVRCLGPSATTFRVLESHPPHHEDYHYQNNNMLGWMLGFTTPTAAGATHVSSERFNMLTKGAASDIYVRSADLSQHAQSDSDSKYSDVLFNVATAATGGTHYEPGSDTQALYTFDRTLSLRRFQLSLTDYTGNFLTNLDNTAQWHMKIRFYHS